MTNIESSVLGQILLYPHTHTYLNKLSPLWFTEWRKDVVTTMQELYLSKPTYYSLKRRYGTQGTFTRHCNTYERS
jgi:hypothetical protein